METTNWNTWNTLEHGFCFCVFHIKSKRSGLHRALEHVEHLFTITYILYYYIEYMLYRGAYTVYIHRSFSVFSCSSVPPLKLIDILIVNMEHGLFLRVPLFQYRVPPCEIYR